MARYVYNPHVMRFWFSLVFVCSGLFAQSKALPIGSGSNKRVKIEATLSLDKSAVEKAVGHAMEEGFLVVEVRVTPLAGNVLISPDDFILRSDKNGERSGAFSPHQIAGSSVMTLNQRSSGGGVSREENGRVWGPIGGGRPQRLPDSSPTIASSGGTTETVATMSQTRGKESPLLGALKEKVLAEKESAEPVTGQLYFLMEGKHKVKQLELVYNHNAPETRVFIRFKE